MNLRRRLQALEEARAAERAPRPQRAPEPACAPAPSSVNANGSAPGASTQGRSDVLLGLRQRMAEILARPARSFATPRASGSSMPLSELPFVLRQTAAGPLCQRIERLPSSHRVGTVGLELAFQASSEVLSRLALDDSIASSLPSGFCFLDLETTGLGGAGSLAFLVGLAGLDRTGHVFVEQLLLDRPSNERALLSRVAERLAEADLLVSFNGKAFDYPLLESRYVMNRMPVPRLLRHLDLLHVGRRLHQKRLRTCTLKRLESEVLGFVRGEDIDGKDVAWRYAQYLQSGDAAGLEAVVEHNYWDVVSMVAFVGLYGQPLPPLEGVDLACFARTLKRAGAPNEARHAAELAYERGGGIEALRVRAELAKARGDLVQALSDFELICAQADDPPSRLQLAKLYEHRLRLPEQALHWVQRGTGEPMENHERRVSRLRRKLGPCQQAEAAALEAQHA